MSSLPMPIPSVLDARTQAFPVLTAAQISRIRSVSQLREVKKGEILFEPDDTNVPFFVLLSGSMEIVQPDLTGERPIATHGPGGFTREMAMISCPRSLPLGRVAESGQFLELIAESLRPLLPKEPSLTETFMRAFILRAFEPI